MLSTETKNAIKFYEILKKDLHTLLVEGGKSPLDYEGIAELYPDFVSLQYPIQEKDQSRKMYNALLDIGEAISNMLKGDVRIWGKTQGIKSIEIAPDHRCELVIMEIIFQD